MAAFRGAGALWGAVDVADANRPHWVFVGSALLGLPDRVHWLAETQVMELAAVWDPHNDDGDAATQPGVWENGTARGSDGQLPWMTVGSLGGLIRRLADAVQGGEIWPEAAQLLFVSNTQYSRSSGYHWISVAVSIEPDDDNPSLGCVCHSTLLFVWMCRCHFRPTPFSPTTGRRQYRRREPRRCR